MPEGLLAPVDMASYARKYSRAGQAMVQIKYTLKCPMCGGTKFQATSAKPGPDDPLACSACGKKIYLGKEKERLEAEARKAVEERLRSQP
jgi:hypothetical protein